MIMTGPDDQGSTGETPVESHLTAEIGSCYTCIAEGLMLALRLPPKVEKRLEALARKTGRTKSHYAKLAIVEFLEDQEDYLLAIARLEKNLPGIPIEEVERRLGLGD